jgi:hypothetical protein
MKIVGKRATRGLTHGGPWGHAHGSLHPLCLTFSCCRPDAFPAPQFGERRTTPWPLQQSRPPSDRTAVVGTEGSGRCSGCTGKWRRDTAWNESRPLRSPHRRTSEARCRVSGSRRAVAVPPHSVWGQKRPGGALLRLTRPPLGHQPMNATARRAETRQRRSPLEARYPSGQ